MARSKANQLVIKQAAEIIAAEQAVALPPAGPNPFKFPPGGYVIDAAATEATIEFEVWPQEYDLFFTVTQLAGTAPLTVMVGQPDPKYIYLPPGATKGEFTLTLTGGATPGTYIRMDFTAVQPGRAVGYDNYGFRITFGEATPENIPIDFVEVWNTDLVTSWDGHYLRGINDTDGTPGWRAIENRGRWQYGQDDSLFLVNNEIMVGQTNPTEATPWRTEVVEGDTVRALRTEWVPNAANGGAGLRIMNDNGHSSWISGPDVPAHLTDTHRSGAQACSNNIMVFRYGYYEVEAWMPYANGLWPCPTWLLPQNTAQGSTDWEIDLAESRIGSGGWIPSSGGANRYDTLFTEHYNNYSGGFDSHALLDKRGYGNIDLYAGFHKYGWLWEADELKYYVDGLHVATYPNINVHDYGFLILMHRTHSQVSGPGFVSDMYIKRIRIWQSQDAAKKHLIWKNEEAPVARSGYRYHAETLPGHFQLGAGGMSAKVWTKIGTEITTVSAARTYGTCANGEKKYYAAVGDHSNTRHGFILAGTAMCQSFPNLIPDNSNIMYRPDGRVYVGNVVAATIQTYTANDIVEACLDRVNDRVWFRARKADGTITNWNNSGTADPVGNVGGIDVSTFPDGALMFGCSWMEAGASEEFVGSTTTIQQLPLPSGYSYL